jgi:hypothetical protein
MQLQTVLCCAYSMIIITNFKMKLCIASGSAPSPSPRRNFGCAPAYRNKIRTRLHVLYSVKQYKNFTRAFFSFKMWHVFARHVNVISYTSTRNVRISLRRFSCNFHENTWGFCSAVWAVVLSHRKQPNGAWPCLSYCVTRRQTASWTCQANGSGCQER